MAIITTAKPIRDLVVAIVFDPSGERVLMIRKICKGSMRWMNGRLNGPGGKVEPTDFSNNYAAKRELEEETNISMADLGYLCTEVLDSVRGDKVAVHFYYGATSQTPIQREAEPVFWLSIEEAINDPALMDNLRHLIPKAHARIFVA